MILGKALLLASLALPLSVAAATPLPLLPGSRTPVYVCPPCPHVADVRDAHPHHGPGTCPVCGMTLVERPLRPGASPAALHAGPGTFTIHAGPRGTREVDVYYYRPRGLGERSPVLIVLPGAGRNAWDYRDHWIDAAERFGVLVLSPHYPESRYPRFWNYNLAGMIGDVVIDQEARAMIDYRIATDRQQWLFDDMDRIFDQTLRATGLKTPRYDLFGHSAGGQFLHRFALFAAGDTRAERILASNAGWYTVPDAEARFPYGLADAPIEPRQLAAAFARRLVVFLGGADDAGETRGDLVRSPETDRQGLHRLARGRHFYARAAKLAASMETEFNWALTVVPGVGHDPKRMSEAAAAYLYGTPADGSSPRAASQVPRRATGRPAANPPARPFP
ncbi:hypothetical protein QFW77_16865 [Luteimonas sp. RD2P54]|uniref:Alpha/beta hydrolase n=1 Tax=Luteimonas endophytica TaxID=3042023 RepID=A0ABT6JDJ4_9GAMM|nr:hypothetical protein [Luteimonas endophytica]MDH5824645.1 hypothetical protein [Luteimonas endophytica]